MNLPHPLLVHSPFPLRRSRHESAALHTSTPILPITTPPDRLFVPGFQSFRTAIVGGGGGCSDGAGDGCGGCLNPRAPMRALSGKHHGHFGHRSLTSMTQSNRRGVLKGDGESQEPQLTKDLGCGTPKTSLLEVRQGWKTKRFAEPTERDGETP